jgi:protein phosphatase
MTKALSIPELSLVVLIGASGSGKSTFAREHFLPTEVISSDYCRALVSDDENSMEATKPAFALVHEIATQRLRFGKLAVIDATNVQPDARKPLVALAKEQDCLAVAIVLNIPERECQDRNINRTDRVVPGHAIRNHCRQLKNSIKKLKREGFRYVYVLNGTEDVGEAKIVRQPLWNNRKDDTGPFDIIGDIHGCFDELTELLTQLGYSITNQENRYALSHPEGRKPVFLGDIADRGPNNLEALTFVMDVCEAGQALCVSGNHDVKLLRKLNGKDIQLSHGIDKTIAELTGAPDGFEERLKKFLDSAISHYVFDDGKLVVAHAGLKESYQGRSSGRVRSFALYGDTTGETDEYGLPVRYDWTNEYRGKALVVYGHTPVPEAVMQNNTICIDTGCVFGGSLTAFRYPERELVSVPAKIVYYEPVKPLFADDIHEEGALRVDDIPDINDVIGKRVIHTRLMANITVREENAMAALETMSRFAADPRWLIYLPPTMSPCETSSLDDMLEHPAEAFSYFSKHGVGKVVCEQKHMGSRAVVIVCKDTGTARSRFGVNDETIGICYTRTGRRLFDDPILEEKFLSIIRDRLNATGFFDEFDTDWVCLDCELMPWSAKAQALLEKQYAPTGVAGREGLHAAVKAIEAAVQRGYDDFDVSPLTSGQNLVLTDLLGYYKNRESAITKYIDAYREYCWPVKDLEGIRLAPFHILATENAVHTDKDHVWHMETVRKYCVGKDAVESADNEPNETANNNDLIMATPYLVVDLADEKSIEAGIKWWSDLTGSGGEGMVVKPFDYIATDEKGLLQPAVKCRGPEYLRIIYGPEYLLSGNLPRLKARSLGKKRSLALREFSLGVESLERFCKSDPFYRVHECVFAVLAMESEPVDPRL